MPDLPELLPCPFCGSRPHACWGAEPNEDGNYTVECSKDDCQATFWHCQSSPQEAIAAWNTRAAPTAPSTEKK